MPMIRPHAHRPPPSGPLAIEGYGANALSALGSGSYVVSSTASGTGAGTLGGAIAWLQAGNQGTVSFSISGTFPLGGLVHLDGLANFFVDGRGRNVSFDGGSIDIRGGSHHFAFAAIRHLGWAGQAVDTYDCFTIADDTTPTTPCHDYAFANISCRGYADEGLSSTRGCYNYTLQDCLFGSGLYTPTHDYGSLNYGNLTGTNGPASFVRNAWIGMNYRNPKVQFGDDGSSTLDSRAITYDVVNNVTVNCLFGLTAAAGAKVNNTNAYSQGDTNGTEILSGAQVSTTKGFTVEAYAQVAEKTVAAAAAYAKANAGCLPHDSFDAALVAQIN